MLIGYSSPVYSATLVGDGADWLNDDGPDTLSDNKPSSVARIQWVSGSSPEAITDYVEIRLVWAVSFAPRVLAFLGASLEAGVKLEVYGRAEGEETFDTALGGNGLTQDTVEFPDQSIGAFFVFAENAESCNGVAIRVYNDLDGVVWATSSSYFDVGEIVVQPAVDVPLAHGAEYQLEDPTIRSRTIGSQLVEVTRTPFRKISFEISPQIDADHYASGLTNSMDMQKLTHRLSAGAYSILVIRWANLAGTLDTNVLQRHAIFAKVFPGATKHIDRNRTYGQISQQSFEAEEIPA